MKVGVLALGQCLVERGEEYVVAIGIGDESNFNIDGSLDSEKFFSIRALFFNILGGRSVKLTEQTLERQALVQYSTRII